MVMDCDMSDQSIVLKGGTLIDGTGSPPLPNSIIILTGGKITEVGSVGEISVPRYSKIIDIQGKTVIPSFIDSHTHFILMGDRILTTLNLSMTKSPSEIMSRVKTRLKELPKGVWLTGHGWDESTWMEKRYPTKFDLDLVSPKNPVILTPYYGHLMVVNTQALKAAKITKETPDPPGGQIDRDPQTMEPTGILREEAMTLIDSVRPSRTKNESLTAIQRACEIVLSWGCSSIHELGVNSIDFSAYQAALESGILKVRTYIMPDCQFTESMLDGLETLGIKTRFGNEFLRIGAVKIYIDGSIGARTAVFSEAYSDESSIFGSFTISPQELEQRVMRAHKLGMQVAIHAIGDRGIDEALNAIETSLKREPRTNHRHRVEHCEVLNEEQIIRIKQLGVVPSMQPNFIGEWGQHGGMYEQRLGQNRLKLCNPYRQLLDEEIVVAFGSDSGYCPPWPFNPLYGLWAAVNHPIEENRISVEEAVKCYTLNGAYASFEDDMKGSIELGKLADITVLSNDLSSISTAQIKNVKVELTIVNGKVCYSAINS